MGHYRQWLIILMSIGSSCHAFVYESYVLKKWNGTLGRYTYFVGLCDFHDNTHPTNNEQFNQLRVLVHQTSSRSLVIGSEDISSPGITNSELCGKFAIQARGSILGDFARFCRSQNLAFNNFEYRYCRVAALGPVLNNLHSDMYSFEPTTQIFVAALVREIESIFTEVNAYQDGPVLHDFYNVCIARVKGQMKEFGLYTHQNKSVADYLVAVTTPNNRLEFMKQLFTFDSIMLDLRVLHNIMNQQDKSYLMFAGGSHTSRVAQLLTKCGYEKVHNTRSNSTREYNLEKCLGSNIVDGAYCQRPTPIDIRGLKGFVKP